MGRARWLRVVAAATTIAACVTYVHYSTTEQHSVVHPSSINFSAVEIGQAAIRNIVISPAAGEQNDVVQSIVELNNCPNFDLLFPNGPPPQPVRSTCISGSGTGGSGVTCTQFSIQSYTFQARFTPTFEGPDSCTLQVTVSGSTSTIQLTGIGQLPPVDVQVEIGGVRCKSGECRLDLGLTNTGIPATPGNLRVVNAGGGTAKVTSVSLSPGYTLVSGNPVVDIGPKSAEDYAITCTPGSAGPLPGTLTVESDDPDTPITTVELACEGVVSEISTSPTRLDMLTRLHETITVPLTIRNVSASTLSVDGFTFSPAGGFELLTSTLQPLSLPISLGMNQTVATNVRYDARLATEGTDPIGTLTLTFDGTKTREVSISGPVSEVSFALTPGSPADLGPVCSGKTHTQTFTLLANGAADFQLNNIDAVTGQDLFSVSRLPTFPSALTKNGGNSIEFDVTVAPTTFGNLGGTVVLLTNIPTETPGSPLTIGLELDATGLGTGPNVTPFEPVDFGSVTASGGRSEQPKQVTFTNCGGPTTIREARIVGDQDFEILALPSFTVEADTPVVFEVDFVPQFGGQKVASIEIEHDSGVSSAVLTGYGDGPLESNSRGSYYRCSTGRATGLVPLLLALFFVLRRRRR